MKSIESIGTTTGSSGKPGGGGPCGRAIIESSKMRQKASFFIISTTAVNYDEGKLADCSKGLFYNSLCCKIKEMPYELKRQSNN